MDWPDYLRDEAAKYRRLAEQTDDPVVKNEMLELASVCDEVRRYDGSVRWASAFAGYPKHNMKARRTVTRPLETVA